MIVPSNKLPAAVRDLRAHTMAHRDLPLIEGFYQDLLEAAPYGLVATDPTGEILLLNARAEEQFGYRRKELIGQQVTQIIPGASAEWLSDDEMQSIEQRAAHQIVTEIECIGQRKDGSKFPIEIMLSTLTIDNGIVVTTAIRDISVRKRKSERAKKLNHESIATVSHELRTPLTSIAGALAVLKTGSAGKLPESATRFITIAYNNSQRLVRLVNDILDIEKIEAGKFTTTIEPVDIRSVLKEAMENTLAYAKSYGVRITYEVPATHCELKSDADWLVQIVTNLLANAIKFSPRGGEVEITVKTQSRNTRISVRDHGPGIPEDYKQKVFEKFSQANSSDAPKKGGTGLGLSIVKQMVTRLGGQVGLSDAPGGGTIFYVDFPETQLSDSV